MQIVIDIPEEVYEELMGDKIHTMLFCLTDAVRNGTPLPKGHGRLIDADALRRKWVFGKAERQEIDDAPTIIEADKEE